MCISCELRVTLRYFVFFKSYVEFNNQENLYFCESRMILVVSKKIFLKSGLVANVLELVYFHTLLIDIRFLGDML